MKTVCAWCTKEGKEALIGEKEPLADQSETHGICGQHREELEARVVRLRAEAERRRQEAERQRADAERQRAEAERQRDELEALRRKVDP